MTHQMHKGKRGYIWVFELKWKEKTGIPKDLSWLTQNTCCRVCRIPRSHCSKSIKYFKTVTIEQQTTWGSHLSSCCMFMKPVMVTQTCSLCLKSQTPKKLEPVFYHFPLILSGGVWILLSDDRLGWLPRILLYAVDSQHAVSLQPRSRTPHSYLNYAFHLLPYV